MRAERGGEHGNIPHRAEATRGAQRFHLIRHSEAVARLDLDGRHALAQQRVETRQGGSNEIILARGAGGAHGGENAAARASDVLVARAIEPHFEFAGAISAEHEMGVAIDETGRDNAAFAVDDFRATEAGRQVVVRPGKGDPPARDDHGAALDQPHALPGHGHETGVAKHMIRCHDITSFVYT